MRRILSIVAAFAAIGFGAPAARAWDATGHMTAADIAYHNLTPKTRVAVNALLQRHEAYASWVTAMPAGYTDKARYVFERAATWPDEIRGTAQNRPIWHYIDIPVIAPGYAPNPAATLIVKPNVVTQITAEAALLRDPKAADSDRAIALSWVEHLVGDIHQPLHAASYFSAQFPKGDRGGNGIHLHSADYAADPIETAAKPRNLHALWDCLLGTTRDPSDIAKIAAPLETREFARKKFPQIARDKTPASWAAESNSLARAVAYDSGHLVLTPEGDHAAASLPAGYIANAHRVADRQIALAGLRLADLLNRMKFPEARG